MICCLLAKWQRLCTSVDVPTALQLWHRSGGSFTRPRSTSATGGWNWHALHLKYVAFKSGITALHLVTIPRTATNLSMSLGFKSRMARVSLRLNVLTCIPPTSSAGISSAGNTRCMKYSVHTASMSGIISCGYDTSILYSAGS